MIHQNIANFYSIRQTLKRNLNYSYQEIDELIPFELSTEIQMINAFNRTVEMNKN